MPAPVAAAAIGQATAIIGKVVDALTAIPSVVRSWVDAFNPAAVRAMDQAFKSLQATVGFALEPVIQGFTSFFRLLSSELNDAFTGLRDVVADVVETGFAILRPVVRLVAVQMESALSVFRAVRPALQPIIDALDGGLTLFTTVIQIVNQLAAAFLEWQAALVADLAKLITGAADLQEAFAQLAFGVIRVTDYLLRLVGLGDLADKIGASFTRRPAPGRPEGLRDQKITGIEDVYRARLLEAAKAQGGAQGAKRGAADILGDLLTQWQKDKADKDRQHKEHIDVLKALAKLLGGKEGVELVDKFAPKGSNVRRAALATALGPLGIGIDLLGW